jgi:hypothetical protein
MYKSVIQMESGSVIWAYLKPLIMGKILYSPDTPLTRRLIEKVKDSAKITQRVNIKQKQQISLRLCTEFMQYIYLISYLYDPLSN